MTGQKMQFFGFLPFPLRGKISRFAECASLVVRKIGARALSGWSRDARPSFLFPQLRKATSALLRDAGCSLSFPYYLILLFFRIISRCKFGRLGKYGCCKLCCENVLYGDANGVRAEFSRSWPFRLPPT